MRATALTRFTKFVAPAPSLRADAAIFVNALFICLVGAWLSGHAALLGREAGILNVRG
jgi:hypothetical protein